MVVMQVGVIQTTVSITAMICPVCGVHYGLDETFRQRALDNGNGWYCTAGHSLSYHETEAARLKTELVKAEKQIEAERGWSLRMQADLEAERKGHAATKGQLTKTRRRVQAGVCPDCHRHFENVEEHMASKHGTPEQAAAVAKRHRQQKEG